MIYTLSYDKREVVYTVTHGDRTETFRMWIAHSVWDWLSWNLEPGDTLVYEAEREEL